MRKVVFTGSTPEQVKWGGNSDPTGVLVVGMEYEVDMQEVHSWHTKIKLKGIDGWFNSVCFRDVDFSQHGKTIVGDAAIIADLQAALSKAIARAEKAEAMSEKLAKALRWARELLEPFADPELSLGLGDAVIPRIDAALAEYEAKP